MNWISVKDRLPENGKPVWAIIPEMKTPIMLERFYSNELEDEDDNECYGWIWCRIYDVPMIINGEWCYDSEWDDEYLPTHWMPLPEPPKEK